MIGPYFLDVFETLEIWKPKTLYIYIYKLTPNFCMVYIIIINDDDDGYYNLIIS